VKVQVCQQIHLSVAVNSVRYLQELNRYNYVTPTSYLQLLAIFSKLVGSKKLELTTAKNRTKTGLDKVR
jgi:dynein heavy chain